MLVKESSDESHLLIAKQTKLINSFGEITSAIKALFTLELIELLNY